MNHNGESSGARRPCKSPKDQLVQLGEPAAPAYWKSVEELHTGTRTTGEFPGGLPPILSNAASPEATRRDFLAMMAFTLAAAGLAGCRAPVQNAIPMRVGSDEIIPGVANFYATTCRGCPSSCSLLVKQRDGRPIKSEANAESGLLGNGTCVAGQATVLSLYDDERLKGPMWKGKSASWAEIDQRVLQGVAAGSGSIVLLSGTITSPSTRAIIAEFRGHNPRFRHIEYDPVSLSAMRQANKESFGEAVAPHYSFDKARVIVSFDADFLGTWLSPVEFARQYAAGRKPEGPAGLHIQFEPGFSVTGSNADVRVAVAPSQLGVTAVALLNRIAHKAGEPPAVPHPPAPTAPPHP